MITLIAILKTIFTGVFLLLLLMLVALESEGRINSGTAEILKNIAGNSVFFSFVLVAGLGIIHRNFFINLLFGKLEDVKETSSETESKNTPVRNTAQVVEIKDKSPVNVKIKTISKYDRTSGKKDPTFLDKETIWIKKDK